jgi:hypothetical protein
MKPKGIKIYKTLTGLQSGPLVNNKHGVVLLITLVVLIILATLSFLLTSRIHSRRQTDQYIIDYTKARYACDSAAKYSLATIEEIRPRLIERPNEPDFSDLFRLTDEQYQQFIDEWLKLNNLELKDNFQLQYDTNDPNNKQFADISGINDTNDPNNLLSNFRFLEEPNNSDTFTVRGPYGPVWPLVTPPMEFEIGPAKVTIEIEDENAKFPLGWAAIDDEIFQEQTDAGLEVLCEWMWSNLYADTYLADIDNLKKQLKQIVEIKPFKLDFSPITILERADVPVVSSSRSTRVQPLNRSRTVRKTYSVADQMAKQGADFSRIFHSSLIDLDLLARPTILSDRRKESALKYISLWSSTTVNINTAPRNVLEAAFAFGGNEVEIADQIILKRRIKPFDNIDELKKELFQYSSSIEKCSKFITTKSTFFTIKITAVSGVARTSALIAVNEEGKQVKRIAIISG